MEKRVVFAGPRVWGRSIEERTAAYDAVDEYGRRGFIIVQGGARGLDTLVMEYCLEKGYRMETHYAMWSSQGRRAGPIRNVKMLSAPGVQHLIAFKRRGKDLTKGTGSCVRMAEQFEVPVKIVETG